MATRIFETVLSMRKADNRLQPRGRPVAIPESLYDQVFLWKAEGLGCRRIADLLAEMGIRASRSSVSRLLLRRSPYQNGLSPSLRECSEYLCGG